MHEERAYGTLKLLPISREVIEGARRKGLMMTEVSEMKGIDGSQHGSSSRSPVCKHEDERMFGRCCLLLVVQARLGSVFQVGSAV
jgi:hypothetical protein